MMGMLLQKNNRNIKVQNYIFLIIIILNNNHIQHGNS